MQRRDFLTYGAQIAALMGLGTERIPALAAEMKRLSMDKAPVLWLQGLSCSGCSISLLNTESPDPVTLLTEYISLQYHSNLSTATGDVAVEIMNRCVETGGYVLVVEGAVPEGMPEACFVGRGLTYTDFLLKAARSAKLIVNAGTCSSFGGIPCANNNPTGACSTHSYLKKNNVQVPWVNLPGCPVHPDWLVGTLLCALTFGLPELDQHRRPVMFYGKTVHESCPRYADYEAEKFAQHLSESGCLFKLGCLGPRVFADCTLRGWNGNVNHCIKANAPCIGCASSDFPIPPPLGFSRKPASSSAQVP